MDLAGCIIRPLSISALIYHRLNRDDNWTTFVYTSVLAETTLEVDRARAIFSKRGTDRRVPIDKVLLRLLSLVSPDCNGQLLL
jgi:hypothetical protein